MDYRLEILGFNLNFGRDFDVFQEHSSCCSQNSTAVFYKSDVDSWSSYFIGYFLIGIQKQLRGLALAIASTPDFHSNSMLSVVQVRPILVLCQPPL